MFEEIFTRNIFEWGGFRSVVSRSIFYRHTKKNGFMAVGVYVDDLAKIRSRNKEGGQMHKELADIFLKNGFTMKNKELADCPDGIDFAGKHIESIDNEFGVGLALTQPSMHDQIKQNLEQLGVEFSGEMTYLPISKGWSPLSAEQDLMSNLERVDTTEFLRLLGKLLYTNQTAIRSILPSVLSSYSRNPGLAEMKCCQEASLHFLATSNVPTTFYRDETVTDMNIPAIQHVYVDAGEAGAVDGSGRKCMIIKYGLPGTNSGSIFIESKKVKKSNSTPMDEMEALASAIGKIYAARTLSEEFAGLRIDPFVTDDIIHGSPNPTMIHTNQKVVETISSRDTGDTFSLIRTQAIKRLQGPSIVFGDNNMVVKIANADGRINIKV
jgi:hypothetical protein